MSMDLFHPEKYSVLYKTNVSIVAGKELIDLPISDLVSIGYICNYDTMTYPIIRIRIYTDLKNIIKMCANSDDIQVMLNMDGNIYRLSDNDSPVPVAPAKSGTFCLKGYFENKNIPVSEMDLYVNGVKKLDDLNENIKYPFEIYCYNHDLIHKTKSIVNSVYKNVSLDTLIKDMFSRVQQDPIEMDELDNHNKYNQILIPNLNVIEAMTYLERTYGIYKKGTQVFGDIDKTYVTSIDTDKPSMNVKPIFISSAKNNTDLVGIKKYNTHDIFFMVTTSHNVSVLTESDIEKTLNDSQIHDLNVKTSETNKASINLPLNEFKESILTPRLLHSSSNEFTSDMYAASISERLTRIDLSGSGFDVFDLKINTRYNMIFESPIRGSNLNNLYRATYGVHVFTNTDSNLFIGQSSFTFCSN